MLIPGVNGVLLSITDCVFTVEMFVQEMRPAMMWRNNVTNCRDIFGYNVRMEMSNCLFNTFNYFCNMIISEVICSFCGCHGERNIPCCVWTLHLNFSQLYNVLREQQRKMKGEANHNQRYEKWATVCCLLLTIVNAKQESKTIHMAHGFLPREIRCQRPLAVRAYAYMVD